MSYSQALSAILNSLQAVQGDLLRVRSKGKVYEGTLMPHHDFSDPDVIILKLKNGYNIGIRISSDDVIEVLEKAETKERPPRSLRKRSDLPRVVLLGTGGTIASYVDYRSGAVHPALSTEDLVSAVPEIGEMASVEAKVLFSIFSENMAPSHWQDLALAAAYELNNGAEAVIIPHGTDTMSYTAAALSFMLGEIPRPVVLVGAQRSSDRPSSDAHSNLLAATRFALEQDVAEVSVLMHSGPSDDAFSVHRGTRVRKMHTSRRDAFQSINV
ncbi:MAG TPA: Glu-tRNA(Gln) amidotransferase subunit GatD, partial [Candidatus Methanomethylophilaceae archaeon]|nr:Glu-tRNA(Gln) amidotransferase subunit GatD [Candidatus Methanomethylophilaceae archaeon]